MERWGAELLNTINRLIDKNVAVFIFLFLMLFSIDSTEIYSIPIPWVAIGVITGVSLFKLFTYKADLEMKVVFIVFILLFIQNISHQLYIHFTFTCINQNCPKS